MPFVTILLLLSHHRLYRSTRVERSVYLSEEIIALLRTDLFTQVE